MSGHLGLQMNGKYSGKYKVTRRETGEEVDGAFVLRPVTDQAAWLACMFYSHLTHNPRLGKELREWLIQLKKDEI